MGNWRTVQIIGECKAEEVRELRHAIDPGETYENQGCLSSGSGICGLNDWADEKINRVGNLFERDYSPKDVKEHLEKIASKVPSLKVKIHCGGDFEDKVCVNTVTCENGVVTIGPPEVEKVDEIPEGQINSNFLKAIMRHE